MDFLSLFFVYSFEISFFSNRFMIYRSIVCLGCVVEYLFPNFPPNVIRIPLNWILWFSRAFSILWVSCSLSSLRLTLPLDRLHFLRTMIFSVSLLVSFCVLWPVQLTDFFAMLVIFCCCDRVYLMYMQLRRIHLNCSYYCDCDCYWLMATLVEVPDRVVAKTISNGYQLDYFRLSYVLRFVADTVGLVALLKWKRKRKKNWIT